MTRKRGINMAWADRIEEYQAIASGVCGASRVVVKEGRFWELAAWLLWGASLGRFSRREFLEDFATTLGPIQAYPRAWSELSPTLIVHEARHTQQFLRAGWFVPVAGQLGAGIRCWAGLLPMALAYGCFPLPLFFAWGRFRLELDADAHSWKAALTHGWLTEDEVRARAQWFGEIVASWAYLKAWPRPWTLRAFQDRAERVIEECRGQRGI